MGVSLEVFDDEYFEESRFWGFGEIFGDADTPRGMRGMRGIRGVNSSVRGRVIITKPFSFLV